MNTVRENLIAARALIDTPEKWIKGSSVNQDRTCFCAMGAVSEVTRAGYWTSDTPEYLALAAQLPDQHALPVFNDRKTTTHADIMALFDRAIAAQEPSNDH